MRWPKITQVVYAAVALLACAALLGLSTVAYFTFYNWYIPPISHSVPLHFDYSTKPATAQVAVGKEFFWRNQEYDLSVDVLVPESPFNLDLGNFMVGIQLYNSEKDRLSSSIRPAILYYRSYWLRMARLALRIIPLLLDFASEAQRLRIPLIENFADDKRSDAVCDIFVTLHTSIDLYEARLIVDARFSGLRYWMYHWFASTALVFIVAAFASQVSLVFFVWLVFNTARSAEPALDAEKESVTEETAGSDTPLMLNDADDAQSVSNYDDSMPFATREEGSAHSISNDESVSEEDDPAHLSSDQSAFDEQ